jgi:hypothetical protein
VGEDGVDLACGQSRQAVGRLEVQDGELDVGVGAPQSRQGFGQ